MTPATSTRRTTAEIIAALTAQVQAVKLADEVTPAFDRVEFFDSEKIADAFQFLLITEQRICVICPLDQKFEPVIKTSSLVIKRTLPVLLFIADRVIGSSGRPAALLGDADTPGADGLTELTLPYVTGIIIPAGDGFHNIQSLPRDYTVVKLSARDEANLSGRVVISLELEITGGTLDNTIGPGPTF